MADSIEAEPPDTAGAGGLTCKAIGADGKVCGAGPYKTAAGLGSHEARIHARRGFIGAARTTREEEWDSVGSLPAGPAEPTVPFPGEREERPEDDYPSTPIDTTPQSELARRVDAQLRDLGYNTSQWKYRRNLIYKNLCRTPALGQTPFALRQFLHNMGIRLEHIELVIMDVWGDGMGPFAGPQAALLPPGTPQPMNPMYAQPYQGYAPQYPGYVPGYPAQQPGNGNGNGNGGTQPKSEFQQFKDHLTFAKEMGLIQPVGQQGNGPAWQDPSNYTKSLVETFAAGKQDALSQQNAMAAMWKQQTDFLTTMLKNEQEKSKGDGGGGGGLIEALNFANDVGLLRKPEDMNDFLEKQKKLQELGLIGTTQNVEVAKFQADHVMNMRRLELDQRRFELEQAAKRQEQVDQGKKFDALTNLAGSAFEKIGNPIARAVSQGLQDRMAGAQGAAPQPATAGPQPAMNTEERRAKLMALRQRVDAELNQAQPQPQPQPEPQAGAQ